MGPDPGAGVRHWASSLLRTTAPGLWLDLKYRQYLNTHDGPNKGEPEIRLLELLVDPDKMAVDVGCHLGMYSRRLSDLASRVIAFEPNPESARFLRRSLGRAVEVRPFALSSRSGSAEMRIPAGQFALGTIEATNSLGGRAFEAVNVEVRTLDSFHLSPVGFIKVDVEGHEEQVILGALETIIAQRPVLLVETEERHNPGALDRIRGLLEGHEFVGCFWRLGRFHGIERFRAGEMQRLDAEPYTNNFFFIPRERRPAAIAEQLG